VRRFDDLHDVLVDGEYFYVVSTRHNEILKLDRAGTEVGRWAFPGEPDSWHINCVARWNGRIVFSAFCDRSTHRGYKKDPLDVGFVQDLLSGERLITGLFQPHSLTVVGDHLLLANSGAFEIHEYDANAVLVRKQSMNGYTRGIAQRDSRVYVGISKTRNVDVGGQKSAEVLVLDAETWRQIDRAVLPVDEIYSLQCLCRDDSIDALAKLYGDATARLSAMVQSARAESELAKDAVEERDGQIRALADEVDDKQRQLLGLFETIHGKDLHIQNRDMIIERKDATIATRDDAIGRLELLSAEKDARIHALGAALEREEQEANRRVRELELRLEAMERATSWRITAPLRAAKGVVTSVFKMIRAPIHIMFHPLRYLRISRDLGLEGSVTAAKHFIRRGGPQDRPNTVPVTVFDLRSAKDRPPVILTTRHCLFIAELLADALRRLDISSEIIFQRPMEGFRDVPHFVICPQMFEELPGLYVAYQMEQSVSSRWFTKDYLQTLENSFAIFDYSIVNIKSLTNQGLSPRQFFYVPVGPLASYGRSPAYEDAGFDYDVVFYGDVNNPRRQAFLAALGKVCRIKVIADLFGEDLYQELLKARLVVNIHYYEGALLETTRLWECLSMGKLVISERSSDMCEHGELEELVDFVDVGDIDGMVQRVRYWLEAPGELVQRIQSNDRAIQSSCSRFDYFFYRFMLYSGNMSLHEFWALVGEKLPAPAEKLCLNLPEYVDRAEAFDKDNTHGFTRFAGLKHPHGWMGCAMSYKFMAMWARKHQLKQLVVCEDDVEFPIGFDSKWSGVNKHLNETRGSWDLFSGILADLHSDATVIDTHVSDGNTYAVIDRMISTVYNVYGEKALELLADWDDQNYDVESNTIDRYMERCTHLRVMTTVPFLVGHKEELYSTLWGMQNTQYTKLIEASQSLLERKVAEWRTRVPENV